MKSLLLAVALSISAFAQISGPAPATSNAVFTASTSATPSFRQKVATFTHTVQAKPNSLVVVGCAEHTWPYEQVVSVTINGVPAILGNSLNSIPRQANTTFWYLTNVLPGVATIVASSNNHGATNGYGVTCVAQSYYGVDQVFPIRFIDSDNIPVLGDGDQSLTCNFTDLHNGEWVVMFEYSTGYNQLAIASALPAPADLSSGRWFGLQIGMAHVGPFLEGDSFSETWFIHHSATGVAFSAISFILRAA